MRRKGWTRRAVLAAGVGAAAIGCSGLTGAPAEPEAAPGRKAGGRTPKPVTLQGEPGTLFLPTSDDKIPRLQFVDTPAWFRNAPAIWCPSPRTAGSSLLLFAEGGKHALANRISHFRELPDLLQQAREYGTDVLYLVDYYEGKPGARAEDYCWNKGEYTARADLGGPAALRDGIAAVKAKGGRVLLYVEPFVIHKSSTTGIEKGKRWSILEATGYPEEPYPEDWKICPANPEFVEHMASITRLLIGEYGANGLHLDSYGYQHGWECVETAHGHKAGDKEVFNEGARALTERMLLEARKIDPEAVLMCEGPRIAGLFRSVSASQDWGIHSLMERWSWANAGTAPLFTSGWSLDDLHQILALGHRLTLGADFWSEPATGTLADFYQAHLPKPIPDKKDHRFRRFFAETYFRELHRFRNAGLLLGRPMPNIDNAAPRRWDRPGSFENHAGLVAILEEGKLIAETIDASLHSAGQLPVPTAYVRKLVKARAKLAPVIEGAQIAPARVSVANVVAWRCEGPNGVAVNVANVGGEIDLVLPAGDGRWRELVEGTDHDCTGPTMVVPIASHCVRMYVRA